MLAIVALNFVLVTCLSMIVHCYVVVKGYATGLFGFIWTFFALFWLSIFGWIIYAVAHFIAKVW